MEKLSEKSLIELTKVSSQLAVQLLMDEVKVMEKSGLTISNEQWVSKRDANIIDAAFIVSESLKALTHNLSDE